MGLIPSTRETHLFFQKDTYVWYPQEANPFPGRSREVVFVLGPNLADDVLLRSPGALVLWAIESEAPRPVFGA